MVARKRVTRRNADDKFRKLERALHQDPTADNMQLLLQEMHKVRDYSHLIAALQRYLGASCVTSLDTEEWDMLARDLKYAVYPYDYEFFRLNGTRLQDWLHTARLLPADLAKGFGGRGPKARKRKKIACIKKLMRALDVPVQDLPPYVWPGGYEILYLVSGGPELSPNELIDACSACATLEVDKGAAVAFSTDHIATNCDWCEKTVSGQEGEEEDDYDG